MNPKASLPISWASPKVLARMTTKKGMGVFAAVPIAAGETVAVFGGFIVAISDLPSLQERVPQVHDVVQRIAYQISDDLVVGPTHEEQFSPVEYLNHSCRPNCGFSSQLELTAMRDIAPDEEITMDYAMCITSSIFDMDCACGESNCRERVRATDWTIRALQDKYEGFFQPYISRKILGIRTRGATKCSPHA